MKMKLMSFVYGKHQLVAVWDNRNDRQNPHWKVKVDVKEGDDFLDTPDRIITPTSPHYDVITRHDFWDIGTLYQVVLEHQKAVFDTVMKARVDKLTGWQWLVCDIAGTKESFELVPHMGGFNIWFMDLVAETRRYSAFCYTLQNALDSVWLICRDIDSWRMVDGAKLTDEVQND